MSEEVAPVTVDKPQTGITHLNTRHFRIGSKARERVCNYFINGGGIGDYICYAAALKYIAAECPQIVGRVYTPEHMLELFEHFLKPWWPRFKVYDRTKLDEKKASSRPTFAPMLRPVNATGAHPFDLGFMYFCSLNPPPAEYNFYPKLDLSKIESEVPGAPYAIMTPGATTENRTMPASAFNGIKDHLIAKGITPMFLGKKQITDMRKINYEDGYNYDGGVDLREKTTLLQAAGLMSKAKLVVGLDNGLLHLAACTEVPIIFGYNIASPEHRRPRRASGNIWEIYPDKKTLPCTFCQSDMRFMFDHDYAYCLYKDNLCLTALAKPEEWTKLIDDVLAKTGDKL